LSFWDILECETAIATWRADFGAAVEFFFGWPSRKLMADFFGSWVTVFWRSSLDGYLDMRLGLINYGKTLLIFWSRPPLLQPGGLIFFLAARGVLIFLELEESTSGTGWM